MEKENEERINNYCFKAIFDCFKSNKLISGTTLIAILTFVGYIITFLSEASYLNKYDLPINLIDVSFENVLINSLLLLILILVFLLIIFTLFNLKKKKICKAQAKSKRDNASDSLKTEKILSGVFMFFLLVQIFLTLININEFNYKNLIAISVYILLFLLYLNNMLSKSLVLISSVMIAGFFVQLIFIFTVYGSFKTPSQVIINNDIKYLIITEYKEEFVVMPMLDDNTIIPVYYFFEKNENDILYIVNLKSSIKKSYNEEYYKLTKAKTIEELLEDKNEAALYQRSCDELNYYAIKNNICTKEIVRKKKLLYLIISNYEEKKKIEILNEIFSISYYMP